ncbi:radical SAM protein [Streptomyces huiliensis]|uniref:radical SAM protein n=1 Tax=Streptomyces huiliensis TaxID=2876027 RepID=UPI001CBBFDCE|nr:radical SAM protein [Streptomyces huiliensis]MBZ4319560.1 radical SAM protein [Streptomyces huiliensis]
MGTTTLRTCTNPGSLRFVWLEVTGRCNETCDHCYADSGPTGTHGTMTVPDWKRAIDQFADMGGRDVQFIGGEPTLYPHLSDLITHASTRRLGIEIFSNMTVIRDGLWETFKARGVKLATSYYSDNAEEHDAVTNLRGSHRKTRANIAKAVELGIPIRGGVVAVRTAQRVNQAVTDLQAIGVGQVGGDRTRAFGRASQGATPTVNDLCGHCALGQVAIGPDGGVWPCVLGRFITLGNVRDTPLAEVWHSRRMVDARAEIASAHGLKPAEACSPPQFLPSCGPCGPCVPSVGSCDPKEAESAPPAATIGAPT